MNNREIITGNSHKMNVIIQNEVFHYNFSNTLRAHHEFRNRRKAQWKVNDALKPLGYQDQSSNDEYWL